MKSILKYALNLLSICASFTLTADERSIVVIIPSFNNRDWYRQNLDSVLSQQYRHFRVIYIDDASTDGTGDFVKEYLEQNDQERHVVFIQNAQRMGALANIYRGVWMCDPSEIVVTLDGDDWLYDEQVLQKLHNVYGDPDVWMTYGQFIEYPTGFRGGASGLPGGVISKNAFREYDWVTTHLRTFYAGLFQQIEEEDLLYENSFFPVTWDLAFMFPLLEMAGEHSHFIPDILYVYNVATPLSDRKLYYDLQIHLDRVIRAKERYLPVSRPF